MGSNIYIPGVNSGLPCLCLWVLWYLQSWKAPHFDCLCKLWHQLFSYIWRLILYFRCQKVWLSSPITSVTNFLLVNSLAALIGRWSFLTPSILGLASNIFSLSFWSARLRMFHQGKPTQLNMKREVHSFLLIMLMQHINTGFCHGDGTLCPSVTSNRRLLIKSERVNKHSLPFI